ncbi:CarD family transcriptional regulator [uncultured Clostridium sp.]|uniref:CarD family transcriptional regulator n=1 Tax=Clostridium TaxID=1485 RepID=UPI001A9B7172
MFDIGDKIVYPMQGAGIIKGIEEKDFCGKKTKYYIIKMLTNNMDIMIPSWRMSDSNIRLISDDSTLKNVLVNLGSRNIDSNESLNSKQRYQLNMDKIKSGSLKDSAEVVYDLTQLNKEKTLNTSESQLLMNARKFLVDEIILIKKITEDEANDLLNSIIS